MSKLNLLFKLCAVGIITIFIFSCEKNVNLKIPPLELTNPDFQKQISEIERLNNIETITNYDLLNERYADDELCKNAYAKECGPGNYTLHNREITFMDCPIEVTYRMWACEKDGQIYLEFEIIDWTPLARCNEFLRKVGELYWGGAEASADELINEMYKHFSNVIESTYAEYLTEIFEPDCDHPLCHTSFVARDCYKVCFDWTYTDEGDLEFGSIIEKQCATGCCFRYREWCYENGIVKITSEKKGGLACIRGVDPQPCQERPGRCNPACNKL